MESPSGSEQARRASGVGGTGGEAADGAHLAVGLDTQLTVLVVYFTVMVARIS